MKFMKKIKDILFDEEEVEIPVIEKAEKKVNSKPVKKPEIMEPMEEKKDIIKEIKIPEETEISDKDSLKSELTFPFPIEFDEDELNKEKEDTIDLSFKREEKSRNREYKNYGTTSPVSKREIKDYSSYLKDKEEKKQFKPTPIISPVYGVLDQNYKKEDLIVKNEVRPKKDKLDLDEIRQKAYGEKPKLKESVYVIEDKDPVIDPKTPIGDLIDGIETPKLGTIDNEPTVELNDLMDKNNNLDSKVNKQDEIDDEEADLFSLIDSMYEENNE